MSACAIASCSSLDDGLDGSDCWFCTVAASEPTLALEVVGLSGGEAWGRCLARKNLGDCLGLGALPGFSALWSSFTKRTLVEGVCGNGDIRGGRVELLG